MEKRSEIKAMKMMVCVTLSMGLSALGLTAGAVVLAGILPAAAESSMRAGKPGPVVVDIDLEKQGAACPKTLWGLFYEDINYAADGGLYPELLANRGFDWQTKELEGWERDARGDGMARITRQYGKPVHEATATHLRIEAFGAGEGVGVKNDRLKIGAPREGALFELPDWTRFETVFTPASSLSVYRIKL